MKTLFVLYFLIACFFMLPAAGQSVSQSSAAQRGLRTDSSAVKVRVPSKGTLGGLRTDRSFIYDDKPEPEETITPLGKWLREQLQRLFPAKAVGFVFQNMSYVIMVLAALVVILVIRKLSLSGVIYRKDKAYASFSLDNAQEEMNIDPELMISEAVKNKDYSTAVRYYYIRSIRQLAGKDLIAFQANKTNSQYIKELREPEIKKPFQKLTLLFERTCYGGRSLEEPHFEEARNLFETFFKAVEERP